MSNDKDKCPVETTLAFLGDKWKMLILRELCSGTKRFVELSRGIPDISQKVMTQRLRAMENDNLVRRQIFAEVPPRVEYSLTEVGNSLLPILEAMRKWGENYKNIHLNL